jgi:hypothetical protein|tara:strand:+ start:749 stop:1201 length:453 start_codon:yes stop_codon:yes gene_type:complete
MNSFPGEKWIKERQWEYYNIQIHTLLSNKINEPEHQELINLYNQYCASDKIVPIQLQEYINMNSVGNDISKSNKFLGQPLNNYKKVILVASVIRRQTFGMNKINAIDSAAKYFKITPEIFFNLYSKYSKRAEEFIEVEPDLKSLDKLLGL